MTAAERDALRAEIDRRRRLLVEGGTGQLRVPQRAPLTHPREFWTRGRIVEAIRSWEFAHGRPPTWEDWLSTHPDREHPAARVAQLKFGSWAAAVQAAGFAPRRRTAHPWRGLRDGQRAAIFELAEMGLSRRAIGRRLGVSHATVCWHLNRKAA